MSRAAKLAKTMGFLRRPVLRLAFAFPAVLSALPLAAQAQWGNVARSLSHESLDRFGASLSGSAMSLVVFDTGRGSWRNAFEKLAATGRLSELPLVFRVAGGRMADELYQREGWAPGPRWALMDWNADVRSGGDAIPSAEALLDALDSCNTKTSLQRLRDFVALNPESVEGRKTLVQRLAQVANRRTAAAMDLKKYAYIDPDRPRITLGDSTGFTLSNVPPDDEYDESGGRAGAPGKADLNPWRDGEIWSEYLAELPRLLAAPAAMQTRLAAPAAMQTRLAAPGPQARIGDGLWAALYLSDRYRAPEDPPPLVPQLAKHSPLCRAAFAGLMPAVEALLKKLPGHGAAWQLWIGMADASGLDMFKASDRLLSELEPLPWTAFDWPPPQLRMALLKKAIAEKDWARVIRYGGERWDEILTVMMADQKYSKSRPAFVAPLMGEYLWKSLVAALLEAHLATGDAKKAEDIMDYWGLCDGWETAFAMAAGMAEKYKYSELARTWWR